MMRYRKSWALAVAAVAVAALFGMRPLARADFQAVVTEYNSVGTAIGTETIYQDYTNHTTTYTFTGAAGNSTTTLSTAPGAEGNVSIGYSSPNATVSGTAGAPPATGSASGRLFVDTTQSTLNVSLAQGEKITISEATNNLGPLTGPLVSLTSTLSNTALTPGASDTLQSYFNQSNDLSVAGNNATGTQGPLSSGIPPGNSASATVAISGSSPFAISNILTFQAGSTPGIYNVLDSATTTVTAAPAPGSLTLVFTGLVCCGPLVWLRRRKATLLAA